MPRPPRNLWRPMDVIAVLVVAFVLLFLGIDATIAVINGTPLNPRFYDFLAVMIGSIVGYLTGVRHNDRRERGDE